ncbi:MAG: tetratricopeptide repeat protein [Candidatus Dadabacteria bacterium]|nr:tetratricopeptide repeat protein [Candidatus Dadabacteria bacterium]
MKPSPILAIPIFAVLLGCVATPGQVKEINERQTALEARMDNLSKEIQEIKVMEEERNKQITEIQKNIERIYARLKKRVSELEKASGAIYIDPLGFTFAESPNALYSQADSYYKERKFEDSILEFQRFIDTYPQDIRVPDSYLKQGLSLINIGRRQEARFFLETLINKFPESKEAKAAKVKLKEI